MTPNRVIVELRLELGERAAVTLEQPVGRNRRPTIGASVSR